MEEALTTKEQILEKVREIYSDEKFRMDAYFFCGFPSGVPNEKLMKACGAYLEAVEKGPAQAEAAELTAQLEAAAAPKDHGVANIVDNLEDIQAVLAHRELL